MKWICFTGIDGVGKTTLRDYTYNLLKNKYRTEKIKIPYFDWVREMIELSGNGSPNKDPYTDMLIFSAANRLEMYLINDIKRKYDVLVSQRSWLDNFPYRTAQGISFRQAYEILNPADFVKPDIIFYLSCDYKTAFSRIKDKGGDKYETLAFMKVLNSEFENMFTDLKRGTHPIKLDNARIIILDAKKNLDLLKKEVKSNLENLGFKIEMS